MDKLIAAFLVFTLALVLGGMALVWSWSKDAALAADVWILMVADSQFGAAWGRNTPKLQQKYDVEHLQRFANEAALIRATPKNWGHREFFGRDQAVVLGGVCKSASGDSITVVVGLRRVGSEWLVDSVRIGADMAQKLQRDADLGLGEPVLSYVNSTD